MKRAWYLVGQHWERHFALGYRGVCGDWWDALAVDGSCPDVHLHERLQSSRERVESKSGYFDDLECTSQAIAAECYEHMASTMDRVIWLEASYFPFPEAVGIDFGYWNWSIVANEILESLAGQWFVPQLNQYQLFSSLPDLHDYLDRRQAVEVERGLEGLDTYEAVWLRIVRSRETAA